jgi:hypothetical protein
VGYPGGEQRSPRTPAMDVVDDAQDDALTVEQGPSTGSLVTPLRRSARSNFGAPVSLWYVRDGRQTAPPPAPTPLADLIDMDDLSPADHVNLDRMYALHPDTSEDFVVPIETYEAPRFRPPRRNKSNKRKRRSTPPTLPADDESTFS